MLHEQLHSQEQQQVSRALFKSFAHKEILESNEGLTAGL